MKAFLIILPFLLGQLAMTAQELLIQSGTRMVVSGNPKIILQDASLVQNGIFVPGQSTLIISGDAPASSSSLGGNNLIPLYRLTINKTSNQAQLDQTVLLADQLLFQAGNLDLHGHELDLLTSGYLTAESENKRLTSALPGGEVLRVATYVSPVAADSGNLGIDLTSSANLGSTTIRRGHFPQSFSGGNGIERYIELAPTLNTGLNATLRMHYFDQELNSLPESDLLLFSSQNTGTNWNPLGFALKDASTNFIELSGIDGFTDITAATFATFPVDWLDFDAQAEDGQVRCQWIIASEESVDHYEVERKGDIGGEFLPVAAVPATGIRQDIQQYEAWDRQPFEGQNIYRITAVHEDGSRLSSNSVIVWFESKSSISVFPNPSQADVSIRYRTQNDTDLDIRLIDARGKEVFRDRQAVLAGSSETELSLPNLATGVYLLRVRDQGRWMNINIIRN